MMILKLAVMIIIGASIGCGFGFGGGGGAATAPRFMNDKVDISTWPHKCTFLSGRSDNDKGTNSGKAIGRYSYNYSYLEEKQKHVWECDIFVSFLHESYEEDLEELRSLKKETKDPVVLEYLEVGARFLVLADHFHAIGKPEVSDIFRWQTQKIVKSIEENNFDHEDLKLILKIFNAEKGKVEDSELAKLLLEYSLLVNPAMFFMTDRIYEYFESKNSGLGKARLYIYAFIREIGKENIKTDEKRHALVEKMVNYKYGNLKDLGEEYLRDFLFRLNEAHIKEEEYNEIKFPDLIAK